MKTSLIKRFLLATAVALVSLQAAIAGDLVYLNSKQGAQRLLNADMNQQYFLIENFVDVQENLGFCGPASMAAALNSLPTIKRPKTSELGSYAYFTQDSLFTDATSKVKSRSEVMRAGLTLQQMALFLDKLGVASTIYYGDTLNESTFRDLIRANLSDSNQRILVNFNRATLNQAGTGHFSPIAAYDTATDSVLILDVAKFKYPPFWVKTTDLLAAMQTMDPDSGKNRGLLILKAAPTQ
mgnify:FL=1